MYRYYISSEFETQHDKDLTSSKYDSRHAD